MTKFGENDIKRTHNKTVTCRVTLLKDWPAEKQSGRDGGYETFPAGSVFVDVQEPIGDQIEISLFGRINVADVKIDRWEKTVEVVTTTSWHKMGS